jgi:hypothetical protein
MNISEIYDFSDMAFLAHGGLCSPSRRLSFPACMKKVEADRLPPRDAVCASKSCCPSFVIFVFKGTSQVSVNRAGFGREQGLTNCHLRCRWLLASLALLLPMAGGAPRSLPRTHGSTR